MHDEKLIEDIMALFSYDMLQKIKEEPFGKFVPREIISPIEAFIEEKESYKFQDQSLEMLRREALDKAEQFIKHFSQQCVAGPNHSFSYIDLEDVIREKQKTKIEYLKKYSHDTQSLADQFCDAILALINNAKRHS